MKLIACGFTLVTVALPSLAHGATLTVGPSGMYTSLTQALVAANDNDTIEVSSGVYRESVTIRQSGLTIRGPSANARAVFDMTAMTIANRKGIFVSAGNNITIENIEFVGASVPDANGAGIRWEGDGTLTVRHCVFRGNENGILGGNHATAIAVIEFNEFVDNGRGDVGYTHNIYINAVDTVTFRGNWSHAMWSGGTDIGHLFKSRARRNFVLYNRLTSEQAPCSYEVNIPQGGEAYVIGNLIQQRVGGQRTMISFGDGDGTQYTNSMLFVVNNTIINENTGNATFVRTTQTDAQVRLVNNLIVGPGTLTNGGMAMPTSNLTTQSPGLVDQAMFDYRLATNSPAIDMGTDPGTANGVMLTPEFVYAHPTSIQPRSVVGALDLGAYEYGQTSMPDAGVVDSGTIPRDASSSDVGQDSNSDVLTTADTSNIQGDGGTSMMARGSCGCSSVGGKNSPKSSLLLLVASLAFARKSKKVFTRLEEN